jgi:hypothetical protein
MASSPVFTPDGRIFTGADLLPRGGKWICTFRYEFATFVAVDENGHFPRMAWEKETGLDGHWIVLSVDAPNLFDLLDELRARR